MKRDNVSLVDGDSSGSEFSLDDELGIPAMKTPGVKKAMEAVNAKLRRSMRVKNPLQRLSYDSYLARHYAYMENVVQTIEPTSLEEAIGNEHWEEAMNEEMATLDFNQIWDLAPLLEGKKAVRCKWACKIKHNADGLVRKYKARSVWQKDMRKNTT